MSEENDIGWLRSREMFQHFTDAEFASLEKALTIGTFADGAIIRRCGDVVRTEDMAILLILEGEILVSTEAVEKSQVAVSRSLKAGEIMSVVSFVNGGRYSADSMAKGEVVVASLHRTEYEKLRTSDTPLAVAIQYMIARQLARDLRLCNQRVTDKLLGGLKWEDLPSIGTR